MTIYDPQSEKYLKEHLPGATLTLRIVASVRYCGIERELVANEPLSATHELVRMIREEREKARKSIQEAEIQEAADLAKISSTG